MDELEDSQLDTSAKLRSAPAPTITPDAVAALPLARFRLVWVSQQQVPDSQYLGSAWRGVFGHALRKLVCVTRMPDCTGFMLLSSCAYPYLFETSLQSTASPGPSVTPAAHPLVLRMETSECDARSPYTFSLVLMPGAVRFLGYIVRAFQEAASHGIGMQRYRFQLSQVLQECPAGSENWLPILNTEQRLAPQPASVVLIPDCPAKVRMRLTSPVRLRQKGNYLSGLDNVGDIVAAVLRRLLLLRAEHGEGRVEQDLSTWFTALRAVRPLAVNLHWHDWERYSNRQQSRMQMGGLLGDVLLDGRQIEPYWSLLWVGQFVHIGKATSMGLGAYTVEEA